MQQASEKLDKVITRCQDVEISAMKEAVRAMCQDRDGFFDDSKCKKAGKYIRLLQDRLSTLSARNKIGGSSFTVEQRTKEAQLVDQQCQIYQRKVADLMLGRVSDRIEDSETVEKANSFETRKSKAFWYTLYVFVALLAIGLIIYLAVYV